ncbi:MAG: putative bifunctional diguanylate cyclase/phosphodiesterase [Geminicoccales bacterium]
MPLEAEWQPSPSFDPFALARRLRTPVWVYDTDRCRIAYANEAACKIWSAEDEASLKSRDLSQGTSKTVADRLKQYQSDFVEHDAKFSEFWTLYPRGEPITVNVVYTGFRMPDNRMAMMCEVIGEAAETPDTLRSTEALLHTDVVIALFTAEGRPLYKNPAARNTLPGVDSGFEDTFVIRSDLDEMRASWRSHNDCRRVTKIKTMDGERWFDISIKRCLDAATGDQALLVTAFDVSELKTTRDKARYLAARDQLTGCFNRSFMQQRLDEISSNLGACDSRYILLFLDIDEFKKVNDTYGHEIGDAILRTFAERVRQHVGEADVLARMGGDEFVLLSKVSSDRDALHAHLEALRTEVAKPIDCGSIQLSVTTSIGVAFFESRAHGDWATTMKQADLALYHSKRMGRDRYSIYDDSIGAEAIERSWLEVAIKQAIENDAFTLFYQPRIDLATNTVVAAEALLRWFHPERGYIPPDKFIPICEEIGVIDQIGMFVFRQACLQMSAWRRQGFEIDVSINVSPKQFQHEDFVPLFESTAAVADFPLSSLELEITETSLIGDDAEVSRRLRRINELGFRLALDDFGTGYSNLAHISRFPVDCIKLDLSFIQQLPSSGPLIRLILALANQIGATTVAEGVEEPEQLAWLRKHGCDQVQGFLFSKAVPADELTSTCLEISAQSRAVA